MDLCLQRGILIQTSMKEDVIMKYTLMEPLNNPWMRGEGLLGRETDGFAPVGAEYEYGMLEKPLADFDHTLERSVHDQIPPDDQPDDLEDMPANCEMYY